MDFACTRTPATAHRTCACAHAPLQLMPCQNGTFYPCMLFEIFWATFLQGMSCEGACAHAHVRCAVARVRVRAKSILKSVRDVRACGSFLGVRCAIALLHTFAHFLGQNCQKMLHSRTSFPILEHPILLWNIIPALECPFLF